MFDMENMMFEMINGMGGMGNMGGMDFDSFGFGAPSSKKKKPKKRQCIAQQRIHSQK